MDGVLMTKNLSVKRVSFIKGGSIGDQERVCQILQLLQLERILVIKNVSAKLFSFFNGGSIGDQERVCQILQLLQWKQYWLSRTCLSNSSASSMEVVLGIKNVSVKLFSSFNGGSIGYQERVYQILQLLQWREYWGSIGDQERVCQTLQLLYWRVYWWSRSRLSNSSTSSMEGVVVIKNLSVKLFSFINGGSIGDQERVCQTLQFH